MIADHLYRLEMNVGKEKGNEIAKNFPDEQLFLLSVQTPWYADIVNYLACRVMPLKFSYQQRRKLRTDCRFYIWDDPLLYRRGSYGGHFMGDKTSQKILQSGFIWPTLFKDCFEWVKHCDACQRMCNISRINEMPLQGILVG